MRVRIHRGTKEIGGNCIELESQGQRLVLDLGMPLSVADPNKVALPEIPGLANGESPDFLGVLISHPHQDHFGLLSKAHPSTPVFIGREAHALLKAAAAFSPSGLHIKNAIYYRDRHPRDIGPFRITPFLNDHSAFDAYSFLIEAEGKALFYTGDFRAHGRKPRAFERLLSQGPRGVDALLMEGTNLGRQGNGAEPDTERQLEEQIRGSLARTRGLALAWFSGQNIDRFVTFFRGAKLAGRTFVVDVYTAHLLDALGRKSLPSPRGPDLRVFLPQRMRSKIVRDQNFDLVKPYYRRRIYSEELRAKASTLVMTFRPTMCQDLEKAGCLKGGRLIYSLWPGYLERGSNDIRAWCRTHGVDFDIQHVSGHAGLADMKRLVEALSPRRVVPIHSLATDSFSDHFPNVQQANDGEWWEV